MNQLFGRQRRLKSYIKLVRKIFSERNLNITDYLFNFLINKNSFERSNFIWLYNFEYFLDI